MAERRHRTPSQVGDLVRIERERTAPTPSEVEKRAPRTRDMAWLTQEELAKRAGIPRDTVAAIERGAIAHPDPNIIHRLAHALGIPVDAFVLAMGYRLSGQADAAQLAQDRMRDAILRAITETELGLPGSN